MSSSFSDQGKFEKEVRLLPMGASLYTDKHTFFWWGIILAHGVDHDPSFSWLLASNLPNPPQRYSNSRITFIASFPCLLYLT